MSKSSPSAFDPGRRRLLAGLAAGGSSLLLTGCGLSRNDTVQAAFEASEDFTHWMHDLLTSPDTRVRQYPPEMISAYPKPNGTSNPDNPHYQKLAANNFAEWRLQVDGEVEEPVKLSLAELRAMPSQSQITRHDCVEGWSYIAKWTGVRLAAMLERVQPTAKARYVVFFCADDLFGDQYYESISMESARDPMTILAYGLNGGKLPIANGAPLRLRAERQLGYKMAKYITRIELVNSTTHIQGGNGGYWEDRGYWWWAGV